ncbi:hypothetical protein BGX33_006942 [Mortierella sp. NVP41]|nr:hypothetical protein BGX33_006942 [Mortierella sp. NVP41]
MLLLVPSHKADEEGGKDATPPSRVLVLLSSDTDISANVVVPDTAITTTLGTSDTLETVGNNYPTTNTFFNPSTAFLAQPKHSRDHFGILRPSRPDDPFGGFHQPIQQSNNAYRSQDRMDDSRLRKQHPGQPDPRFLHPYGGNDINYSRARRHSHTGLVEPIHSGPRMRSRQSISLAAPFQHQSLRTPRPLKGALRKSRKEQSPLLTSASFGTDYAMQNPAEEWEGDDIFLPWKTPSSTADHTTHPSTTLGSGSPKSLLKGSRSLSHLSSLRGQRMEEETTTNNNYDDLDSIDSGDDIDVDWVDNDNDITTTATMSPVSPTGLPKLGHRDSSEIVDVEGLSDEEMAADVPSKATTSKGSPASSKARVDQWLKESSDKKSQEDRIDLEVDIENSLDADMNMILGMASDMELMMPKFDDKYLQDMNNEPVLNVFTGRSSSVSAVSPSCSHSSLTTITCISSQPSPSLSMTSGMTCSELPLRGESSPSLSDPTGQRALDAQSSGQQSASQNLSSFHRDIDILRRHREGLKEGPDLPMESSRPNPSSHTNSSAGSHPFTLSSSASPSSPTTEKQSKPASHGPIYFKPSHHILPDRSGPGENPHQNVMIIQSNQWTMDNKGVSGTRVFPPQSTSIRGNEGNHIYMVRECSPTPPPPPLLDKSAIMTTHNISLATANMNVLTPQEVQEDYYLRRNMRLNQQRQRRRSSAAVAAAVAAAAAAVGPGAENRSFQYEGISPLASASASSSSSSSSRSASVHGSDLIHPFDHASNNTINRSVVVPTMGATMLPTSYYIPPSAFRTEAAVAAERNMERKRKEEEEALKDSFLVFPSPSLS